MKKLVQCVSLIALLSPCSHALNPTPKINALVTMNACTFKRTNNTLDMALINRGYFVIRRGNAGPLFYTRYGKFQLNAKSEIVNSNGDRLMSGVDAEHLLKPIKISTDVLKPNPTRHAVLGFNLPLWTNQDDDYQLSLSIYDALGSQHVLTHHYTKMDIYTWKDVVEVDDQVIATGELKFKQEGVIDTDLSLNNISWASPYGAQKIQFDLSGITQYSMPFSIHELYQDGYFVGSLSGMEITADGVIVLKYTNNQTKELSDRITVATFDNPEKLTPIVEHLYAANVKSGEANFYPESGNGVFLIGYLQEKKCLPQG